MAKTYYDGAVLGNEPFGSRSEPGIQRTRIFHLRLSGEIPEGRAVLVPSLYVYVRQRTLEPVLEPGVTKYANLYS